MRLVIDTNILVSALLAAPSLPAQLVVLWRAGRFDLLNRRLWVRLREKGGKRHEMPCHHSL